MRTVLLSIGLVFGLITCVPAQQKPDKPTIESIDALAYHELLKIEEGVAPRYSTKMISGGFYFCDPRACDPLWEIAAGLPARFESYDLLMGHPLGYDIIVIINRYDENERELMLALNRIWHNRRLK